MRFKVSLQLFFGPSHHFYLEFISDYIVFLENEMTISVLSYDVVNGR